eukprot:TRINITY_DN28197_c0_g1_i1.p1 TRINITY_DN28197_c0_g1~~TRINITY_DN28197_c0_g1_i1.p1  ORF type:complete len:449 (+),score=140.58 TRINITY_DN28197_c0_g1_i1:51-1397(+)
MGDWVAGAVLAQYDALPAKGKPQGGEHSIVAGVVREGPDGAREVVALGTGSGCVSSGRLARDGAAVIDGHAEVMCRRALVRYLFGVAKEHHACAAPGDAAALPVVLDGGRLRLTGTLHMYVSQLPCGDACIHAAADADAGGAEPSCETCETLPEGEPPDAGAKRSAAAALDGAAAASPPSKRPRVAAAAQKDTGARRVLRAAACAPEARPATTAPPNTVDTLVYKDFGDRAVGAVRNKPGRGAPSASMSCSDKIARWCVLGLQGALLDPVYHPVHLATLTVSVEPGARMDALERAVNARGAGLATHRPLRLAATARAFAHSNPAMKASDRVMCGYSLAWWAGLSVQDVTTSCAGHKAGATKRGIRAGQADALVARRQLFALAYDLAAATGAPADRAATYAAAKAAARRAAGTDAARAAFFAHPPFDAWVRKDPALGGFTAAEPRGARR